MGEKFQDHYNLWIPQRVDKLVSILGSNWFKDKTILELGCGYGYVGEKLQALGAYVTFTDGRKEHIQVAEKRIKKGTFLVLDQDKVWNFKDKFDLIINWGVSYHLDKWEQDLECCIKTSDLICLETEVSDWDDEDYEIKINEPTDLRWYDNAKNNIGTRPTAAKIEKFLHYINCNYKRYDDLDLNCSNLKYTWKVENTKKYSGYRRFWIITPNKGIINDNKM